MPDLSKELRCRQTSQYLRELLQADPYAARWQLFGRKRYRDVHQGAVAKVIATHIAAIEGPDVPIGLQQKISRVLTTKSPSFTAKTLELFIDAFEMSHAHAEKLRRLYSGKDLSNVVFGSISPSATPPEYRTVVLHEFHHLGADGRPTHHRTIRAIRSLKDGLKSIKYSFDTSELDIERIFGGQPGDKYHRHGNIWTVDVELPRTLDEGEEHSVEFATKFKYTGGVDPCFRRVVRDRVENLSIRVEFHPERLPAELRWVEWRDYEPPNDQALYRRPVTLDGDHAAYHRLDAAEHAVVGFEWHFERMESRKLPPRRTTPLDEMSTRWRSPGSALNSWWPPACVRLRLERHPYGHVAQSE